MTPESFSNNINVVRYIYARSLASLFFSRWIITIVSSLSIVLIVQDLYNYRNSNIIPVANNLIVLALSLIVLLYTLRRIKVISSVSIGATHDLALLTAFLDLKNYQLNLNTNKDDFIEDYGKKLDLEIRKRYNIR
jgi:hypothetical protein